MKIRPYILTFLAFLFCQSSISAQQAPYFQNLHEIGRWTRASEIIPADDGSYFVYVGGRQGSRFDPSYRLRMKPDGAILDTLELDSLMINHAAISAVRHENQIFLVGFPRTTSFGNKLWLFQQNLQGAFTQKKTIAGPENLVTALYPNAIFHDGNKVLVSGFFVPKSSTNNLRQAFLMVINDQSLEIEKFMHLLPSENNAEAGNLTKMLDGRLILSITRRSTEGPNVGYLVLDNEYEVTNSWETPLGSNTLLPFNYLLENGKVLVNTNLNTPPGIMGRPNVHLVNPDGSYHWSYPRANQETSNHKIVKTLRNGDLLILGSSLFTPYFQEDPPFNFTATPMLMRISPEGEIRWHRLFAHYRGRPDALQGSLENVIELEDGNLWVIGWAFDVPFIRSYMISMRLDEYGCADPNICNGIQILSAPEPNRFAGFDESLSPHKQWNYITEKEGLGQKYTQHFGIDTFMKLPAPYQMLRTTRMITTDQDGHNTIGKDQFRWLLGGQTLMHPDGSPTFFTLYDFSLKAGDQFALPRDYGIADVVSVDSIRLTDGSLRKRIILRPRDSQILQQHGELIWIDGIGSLQGFLYYHDWDQGTKTVLSCYEDRGVIKYRGPWCEDFENPGFLEILRPVHVWVSHTTQGVPDLFSAEKISFETTELDEKLYRQILKKQGISTHTWEPTGQYLREQDGRLYSKSVGSEEILLLDMNLQVDDKFALPTSNPDSLIVIRTGLVQSEEGRWRKIIELRCPTSQKIIPWIEGIGNIRSTFDTMPLTCSSSGDEDNFACFYDENRLYFTNPFDIPCSLITSKDERPFPNHLTIYPNPTQGRLYINLVNLPREEYRYEIIQLDGRIIHQEKIESTQEDTVELQLPNLVQGMYILSLQNKHHRSYHKFYYSK